MTVLQNTVREHEITTISIRSTCGTSLGLSYVLFPGGGSLSGGGGPITGFGRPPHNHLLGRPMPGWAHNTRPAKPLLWDVGGVPMHTPPPRQRFRVPRLPTYVCRGLILGQW